MQNEAVYGLTEISRREIQDARLVANPGCYPTSIQLPLIPLIKVGLLVWDMICSPCFCKFSMFLLRLLYWSCDNQSAQVYIRLCFKKAGNLESVHM